MNVFHAERDSLVWWRSDTPYFNGEVCASPCTQTMLDGYAHTMRDITDGRSYWLNDAGNIDLLVPTRCTNRSTRTLSFHRVGFDLPGGSLYEIGKNEFVCSAELTFYLMASRVGFYELVCLGMELCGRYSLRGKEGFFEHDPITTKQDILNYLDALAGQRHVSRARRAAERLCDGSRSPRESDLYMMLCLPSKCGGFGLSGAELNRTLSVTPRAVSQTGMESITPDLSWIQEKVVAEYESNQWHALLSWQANARQVMPARNQIAADSMRRRTYEAMGLFVVTITNEEFNSFVEMTRIATTISRRLGRHGLCKEEGLMWRRQDLHEWLKVPAGSRGKAPVL